MTTDPKTTAEYIGRKWDELDEQVRRSGRWRRLPNTVNDEFHTPHFIFTVGLYWEILEVRPCHSSSEGEPANAG